MESFSGEIKSVKMDLDACQVSFTAGEGSGLTGVEYEGPKDLTPETSFADGTLTITQNPVSGIRKGIMAISKPKLMVTIGKDMLLNNLDVHIAAGDISMNGISADLFSEVVDAGNINISDSNFLKAEIGTKAGNINISNTNLNMVVIDAKVGSVTLDAIEDLDQYTIECRAKTGDIRIDEERYGKEYISKGSDIDYIKITVNAGSVEIN